MSVGIWPAFWAALAVVLALLIWNGGDVWLRSDALLRENYAGRCVPVCGGLVVVIAVGAVVGIQVVVRFVDGSSDPVWLAQFGLPVLVIAFGFGMLGFVDDALGSADVHGFAGHIRAWISGKLTTGFVKLAGGAALGLVAVASRGGGVEWLFANAAVVALAANLGNLLDRAPGRLLKASVLGAAPFVVVGWNTPELAAAAPVFGAAWTLLPADCRERLMLGDTGANVVGATIGWLAVWLTAQTTRLGLLAGLVALNLLAEAVSFSRLIEAIPPLRWLDNLGRLSRHT